MAKQILANIWAWLLRYSGELYLLAFAIISLNLAFEFPKGSNLNRIYSDSEGYYMYLPAIFVYKTFDADQLPARTKKRYGPYKDTNLRLTQYTYGIALLESPFFLFTHVLAKNDFFSMRTEERPNGYAKVYSNSIVLAAIFYCMMGLWFLQIFLRRFFSRWVVFVSLFAIYFGTNLFFYTICEAGMSHAYSFFLFAALVNLTPKVYENPTYGRLGLAGLLMGLIFLVRPTNIVFWLFPICYDLTGKEAIKARLHWVRDNLNKLWIIPLIAFLPLIPQMFYWHYISGEWLMKSYGDHDFFRYLTQPKMLRVWFDVQNGLFIYTPLLWLSMLGLAITSYRYQFSGPVITFMFLLSSYIFGSYYYWWFGGSLGQRSFVEFYAVLIIPMAYIIQEINRTRLHFKLIWHSLIAILTWYSFKLAYLYRWPWEGPKWNWNKFDAVLQQVFTWPF